MCLDRYNFLEFVFLAVSCHWTPCRIPWEPCFPTRPKYAEFPYWYYSTNVRSWPIADKISDKGRRKDFFSLLSITLNVTTRQYRKGGEITRVQEKSGFSARSQTYFKRLCSGHAEQTKTADECRVDDDFQKIGTTSAAIGQSSAP